ncbi:odorant receptor 94a-like [Bradysia coprophila]|uniref:odorant receptor 94a-like n=1 Tax=Bradysia coprophila TaxID=38358 RepID=UPI00187D80F5|nr:odorant receptor 94a-like [Bradysia coprophila]
MHSVQSHRVIGKVISIFYWVGYWHRRDHPTAKELGMKVIYCLYYSLFGISLTIAGLTSQTSDESIFLWESCLVILISTAKILVLIQKQKRIVRSLNLIGVFSIRDAEDVTYCNFRLGRFMKFVVTFLCVTVCAITFANAVPFFSSERKMIVDFAFPLDWRNGGTAFWISYTFITTEIVLTFSAVLFTVVVWYLMLLCSLRYEVIGREIVKAGSGQKGETLSVKERHNLFRKDVESSIIAHRRLRGFIDELVSFVSKLFLLQFGTGATCICLSVYCLAFDIGDNSLERMIHLYALFYHISELFMITHFGNEIMLSSSRLSYKLFESNWVDQPESTKKVIITFGQYLKRPHEVFIGKLFPLTLETFVRILKSAYSFFNVLKNYKQ